ncbi:MAG: hypothetical protein ACXIVQ_09000 [Acidimicrobiales bacterium]
MVAATTLGAIPSPEASAQPTQVIVDPVVNRDFLRHLIDRASARQERAYTPASWTEMQGRLQHAINVDGDAGATQLEVDEAATMLSLSINNLRPPEFGYTYTTASGEVYAFGASRHHGSLRGVGLSRPIVDIESTLSGNGYWLVASDGGIFSFGDAGFYGSTGAIRLNQPIVGMAGTPSGRGYWLVASDGGIFSFGDAGFYGSTGAIRLNQPIVGMAGTPSGRGYWLVASDGGIFNYGDARFHGTRGGSHLEDPVIGLVTAWPGGYTIFTAGDGVFPFWSQGRLGNLTALDEPLVGVTGRGSYIPPFMPAG